MNVNFFITCVGDTLELRVVQGPMLLLKKLGYHVNFPEKQGRCDQPAINSGYIKETIPGMKDLVAALKNNGDPIISPTDSCTYAARSYPMYLADESEWVLRAEKISACMQDLTSFIVNGLDVVDVDASLQGRAVCHPSCSLTRELGVKEEPLTLLEDIYGLELLTFADRDACRGFGGTFSIKTAEISGETVKEKVLHLMDAKPEYLIDTNVSCLLNIGGRLQREGQPIKVMCIVEVLMSRRGEEDIDKNQRYRVQAAYSSADRRSDHV